VDTFGKYLFLWILSVDTLQRIPGRYLFCKISSVDTVGGWCLYWIPFSVDTLGGYPTKKSWGIAFFGRYLR